MKCVIKRPKLIIKNIPKKVSHFIIYFSQSHCTGKRQFSLFRINFSDIESSSRECFIQHNICPFYRRNNIVLGFVETKNLNHGKTLFFLIDKKNNYSDKQINSYINNKIYNNFFSLKVKHLVKDFFQNRCNQFHHH